MREAGRLLTAGGQGALAGWTAGLVFSGWWVLLGEDFTHSLHRLGILRLGFGTLAGALLGAALSVLLFLALKWLQNKGRGWFAAGVGVFALLYLVLGAAAAFPLRQKVFRLHQFSPLAVALAVFATEMALIGGLLAWRVRERIASTATNPPAPVWAAITGWGLAVVSGLSLAVVSHLPLAAGAAGRPIILVSLDTLRADRLGCLGNPRPATPHLDRLAREGTLFEQAMSTAPWTLPSHASLFSSLLPFDHGSTRESRPLRPSLSMLAERLRNAGYRTAAFTGGAYVSSDFGFGQGFESYEDHDEGKEGGGKKIAEAALTWVRSVRDQPFFVFVHTYEVHYPYNHTDFVEEPFRSQGKKPFDIDDLAEIHRGKKILSPEDRRFVSQLYDGDVASADRVMGGMLDQLREEGILDRAILVVLSDHGDDLWDHDEYWSPGHGHSLYQELVHVPLIFRAPGLVAQGKRVQTPVSLLDVLPTLLAMEGMRGEPQDEGRSLAPSLASGSEPPPVPMNAEGTEYGPDRFTRRSGNLKVVITPQPEELRNGVPISMRPLELFDLAADPREQRDLTATPPPGASELTEELWKRVEAILKHGAGPNRPGQIPRELQEQLRSLGYVH